MAIPDEYKKKLAENDIKEDSPGWKITESADVATTDTPSDKLFKLMGAFYGYGRTQWQWTTSSSSSAGDGGLLRGNAKNCACATFNDNLKFLAERICGVTGITRARLDDHFITKPGGVCIDGNWRGNVQTGNDGYDQFKCFKFATHYWLTLGGEDYDVCYNTKFAAHSEEFVWSKLLIDSTMSTKLGRTPSQFRKLATVRQGYEYIVEVKPAGSCTNGWPLWQLCTAVEVGKLKKI